jgi:hypothetical protein
VYDDKAGKLFGEKRLANQRIGEFLNLFDDFFLMFGLAASAVTNADVP